MWTPFNLDILYIPDFADIRDIIDIPDNPNIPNIPDISGIADIPAVPHIPYIPHIPDIAGIADIPDNSDKYRDIGNSTNVYYLDMYYISRWSAARRTPPTLPIVSSVTLNWRAIY